MNSAVLGRAETFLTGQARLLERRLFACHFRDGDPDDVRSAVRSFRNADGGFGYGLESDLRTAASQPIHVEMALNALCEVGHRDQELALGACGFLETVCDGQGAVPPALPGAGDEPCASHWKLEWAVTPDVNPTAGIAGRMHQLGVRHPWLDRATDYTFRRLESDTFKSAHTLRSALTFLEHVPDRTRAEALLEPLARQLSQADWFLMDVPIEQYGQTPLHFAPTPDSLFRRFFKDDLIEAHLDDLLRRQKPDGGWPVLWEAPTAASICEWRGRWTLDALLALRAYGRV